jgi:hypothetical protein
MCFPVGKPLWKSENRSTCGKCFWKVWRYQRGNHKPLIEDGRKHIHNYITVLFQICYHELCCHIFPDESLLIKFYIGSLKLLLSIQSIYLMYISLYKSKSVYINKFIFRGNVLVYIPDDRYLTLVQISSQDVYNYPNQKYV